MFSLQERMCRGEWWWIKLAVRSPVALPEGSILLGELVELLGELGQDSH